MFINRPPNIPGIKAWQKYMTKYEEKRSQIKATSAERAALMMKQQLHMGWIDELYDSILRCWGRKSWGGFRIMELVTIPMHDLEKIGELVSPERDGLGILSGFPPEI